MAEMVLGHQGQALIDSVLWSDGEDRAGHNLFDLGLLRRVAKECAFARVIALRKDAEQVVVRTNQKRANVEMRHHLEGFKYGLAGRNGKDLVLALAFEHNSDRVFDSHLNLQPRGVRWAPDLMEMQCSAICAELSRGNWKSFQLSYPGSRLN